MVFKHIKSMLGIEELETAGNLYLNKTIEIKGAKINIVGDKIVVEGEKRREFPFSEISYVDFLKTETKEISLYFTTEKKEKWQFVFRENLPRTIVQFYGKIFPRQAEINKWTVLFGNDSVSLFGYSVELGSYQLIGKSISVRLIRIEEFVIIRVYSGYEIIRKGDLLTDYSDFYIDQETMSFSWAVKSGKSDPEVYRIIFSSLPTLFSFISTLISSTTKEEVEYVEKMEIDNYNYSEEEESSDSSEASSEESVQSAPSDELSSAHFRNSKKEREKKEEKPGNIFGGKNRERNKALAISTDNTFVSKGSSIGVFENKEDLFYIGSIEAEFKNKKIIPEKMIVTKEKDGLILTDKNSNELVHKIDLETGKVAETWKAKDEIKDFFASSKDTSGPSSSEGFLGVSSNKLFKIDPRAPTVIEGKEYSTNTKFRSGDSTKNGYFAIGSDTGNIRLYDSLDKRAKTLLPGLGDPVTGVFISPSGKYLVGTCKTYLMLILTENEKTSGFKKSLGDKKPVPKKLMIRPEDLHHFGGVVNFTNASISTDSEEKYVIVSTGQWNIVWNMQKVLKGNIFSYYIKKNDNSIVSNSFIPGDSNKIVVAMDDDLEMISRLSLKKTKHINQK